MINTQIQDTIIILILYKVKLQ